MLDEGTRVVAQYASGLVKLPTSIRNAKDYKACGDYFLQYLDCYPNWVSLQAETEGLSPTAFDTATHAAGPSTTT